MTDLALFLASLFVLIKSAEYAVCYSSKIARAFRISEFVVSFFIVAFISCSPEATVSIISAINGVPEFGLGALLGSNVADLALVFGVVALFSANGVKVKSQIVRNDLFYLVLLLVPIILGFDGHLSREDGVVLILSGAAFLATLARQSRLFRRKFNHARNHGWAKNFVLLVLSLAFLVAGAYYTVKFGIDFANDINIPPFLVALTMVSIGSCMPELIFSLKAVRTGHDALALGDILGNVIIDATILIGVISLISPFDFNPSIVRVTGVMMFFAGALAVTFIKSGKVLTRVEGLLLLLFYLLSLAVEFWMNGVF
ncbi:MAG: sodium:calcium antiporter [Candidatus ainarchaeum sp.]|nr:sodium:calcium antiporter [Candidatus ainarchaeum sp.]